MGEQSDYWSLEDLWNPRTHSNLKMQGHIYDFRYLTIIEKETSGTKHNPWYYCSFTTGLLPWIWNSLEKNPRQKNPIDCGHLNSASFGQRLAGSNSLFMTFKEVTNKLFWIYNINKADTGCDPLNSLYKYTDLVQEYNASFTTRERLLKSNTSYVLKKTKPKTQKTIKQPCGSDQNSGLQDRPETNPQGPLCHSAPKSSPSLQQCRAHKHCEADWCLQVIHGSVIISFSSHLPLWSSVPQTWLIYYLH